MIDWIADTWFEQCRKGLSALLDVVQNPAGLKREEPTVSLRTRVGFSTGNSWISKLIRKLTKSRASHAFLIYYDNDFGRDMVMEATKGGFKVTPYDKFAKHTNVITVLEPKYSMEKGLSRAVDWLGDGYDYTGLFGMLFVLIGRWLKLKWRNPLSASGSMFCSEAVARAMHWSMYPGTEEMEVEDVTPEDLLVFFEKERQTGG